MNLSSTGTGHIESMEIKKFYEVFSKNTLWSDDIDKNLEYQKGAYFASQDDCQTSDKSFFYEDKKGICFFSITLMSEGLSDFGLAIFPQIFGKPDIDYCLIRNKFTDLIIETKVNKISLSEDLVKHLNLNKEATKRNIKIAEIDLTQEEDKILKAVSKGHKSSIKSGQKILEISLINSQNFSQFYFDQLIELYSTIAKKNKSDNFWHFIKQAILEDTAFFVIGYYESKPASCQLFYNTKSIVTYAMAAYDRDLMSLGLSLSHWPLYRAILYSKEQRFNKFIIGYLYEDEADEKVTSIFKFKSKFTGELKQSTYYEFSAPTFLES